MGGHEHLVIMRSDAAPAETPKAHGSPRQNPACAPVAVSSTLLGPGVIAATKAKKVAVFTDVKSDYSKGLAKFFKEGFLKAGLTIYEGYGMTESGCAITSNRPRSWCSSTPAMR